VNRGQLSVKGERITKREKRTNHKKKKKEDIGDRGDLLETVIDERQDATSRFVAGKERSFEKKKDPTEEDTAS